MSLVLLLLKASPEQRRKGNIKAFLNVICLLSRHINLV